MIENANLLYQKISDMLLPKVLQIGYGWYKLQIEYGLKKKNEHNNKRNTKAQSQADLTMARPIWED